MSEHNLNAINNFASLSISYMRSACNNIVQVFQEMMDCFNYTLLYVFNVFISPSESKNPISGQSANNCTLGQSGYGRDNHSVDKLLSNMDALKGNILRYLYGQKNGSNHSLFAWSALESANIKPELSPVQGDLFEFLISYTIFHSQTEQEDQDFFEDLYERFGATHYIRYLNQRI